MDRDELSGHVNEVSLIASKTLRAKYRKWGWAFACTSLVCLFVSFCFSPYCALGNAAYCLVPFGGGVLSAIAAYGLIASAARAGFNAWSISHAVDDLAREPHRHLSRYGPDAFSEDQEIDEEDWSIQQQMPNGSWQLVVQLPRSANQLSYSSMMEMSCRLKAVIRVVSPHGVVGPTFDVTL